MNMRDVHRNLRIRTKLVLMVAVLMGGISAFIVMYFSSRQEKQEILSLAAKGRSISDMTAFAVAPALAFHDRRTVEDSFDAARQNLDLAYIVVLDDSGRVAGSYNLADAGNEGYAVADEIDRITPDKSVYRVVSPVLSGGRKIGSVCLGLSLNDLRADTSRSRSAALAVSIVIFIVSTISVIVIGSVLTIPLRRMVAVARRITLGDLSIRAAVTSGDEAGQLAGAFNCMVENLQATQKEIEEANRSLERRVEARTGELRQEIADRKKAEEKLRQSEEQFRLISENVADMIALLDVNGNRVYNSPSYKNVLGESAALLGTNSFNEIHPEDRARITRVFTETVRTGIGTRAEYRFQLADGSVRHIESQGSVVRGADGKVSHVIVVSRDMTEQKILERKFLRAQRMESLGTLASGIAHDLNNVLAPIMMSIEVLRGDLTGDTKRRVLDSIESSARRGSNIVKQVLAFGRGLAGDRILLQPKHIIHEIAKIVEETFPKSLAFNTDVPRNLWTISADPTQMHQVILNICVNARDSMPDGGSLTISARNVTLDENSARMESESKPGPHVAISITDTGTGIPPEITEKIFEPFFTTKEMGQGTGLGLPTTLGIVKSHGGFIDVKSEIGRGTTFTIFLPALVTESTHSSDDEDALPAGHGELILAIDDEEPIREILKETLSGCGFRVVTARDGEEGVREYARQKADISVVITDMMMPNMDGTATIEALRAMNPDLKIIGVSGLMGIGGGPERPGSGMTRFLPKPHTSNELVKLVHEVLAMR